MADKPTAKFDDHEHDNVARHVQDQTSGILSGEAQKAFDANKKGTDRVTPTDFVMTADGGDGAVAKTNPEQYKSYASVIAAMPEDGIGSKAEAKGVVDYFKQAYPQNYAFNSGVEKAVFT